MPFATNVVMRSLVQKLLIEQVFMLVHCIVLFEAHLFLEEASVLLHLFLQVVMRTLLIFLEFLSINSPKLSLLFHHVFVDHLPHFSFLDLLV